MKKRSPYPIDVDPELGRRALENANPAFKAKFEALIERVREVARRRDERLARITDPVPRASAERPG